MLTALCLKGLFHIAVFVDMSGEAFWGHIHPVFMGNCVHFLYKKVVASLNFMEIDELQPKWFLRILHSCTGSYIFLEFWNMSTTKYTLEDYESCPNATWCFFYRFFCGGLHLGDMMQIWRHCLV